MRDTRPLLIIQVVKGRTGADNATPSLAHNCALRQRLRLIAHRSSDFDASRLGPVRGVAKNGILPYVRWCSRPLLDRRRLEVTTSAICTGCSSPGRQVGRAIEIALVTETERKPNCQGKCDPMDTGDVHLGATPVGRGVSRHGVSGKIVLESLLGRNNSSIIVRLEPEETIKLLYGRRVSIEAVKAAADMYKLS